MRTLGSIPALPNVFSLSMSIRWPKKNWNLPIYNCLASAETQKVTKINLSCAAWGKNRLQKTQSGVKNAKRHFLQLLKPSFDVLYLTHQINMMTNVPTTSSTVSLTAWAMQNGLWVPWSIESLSQLVPFHHRHRLLQRLHRQLQSPRQLPLDVQVRRAWSGSSCRSRWWTRSSAPPCGSTVGGKKRTWLNWCDLDWNSTPRKVLLREVLTRKVLLRKVLTRKALIRRVLLSENPKSPLNFRIILT